MKKCPFCGAELQDSFMFCAACGNPQPAVQQPAPQQPAPQQTAPQQPVYQQPVPQQPVYQQPAPAPKPPKPPKQPTKLHFMIDDLMKKYVLLGYTGLLALMTLINLVDNIPMLGYRYIGVGFKVLVVLCMLANIGAGVMSFFGWTFWKKEKTMGPVFAIIASGVATFFNLIYIIVLAVVGIGNMIHFPLFNLLMFLASSAILVFSILAMTGLKGKFHK